MIVFPQDGDLVYTPNVPFSFLRVKECIGFLDADADGIPEAFYVRLNDDTEAKVWPTLPTSNVDRSGMTTWTLDRRLG